MIENIPPHIIHKVQSLNLSLGDNVPNREIGELLDRTVLLGGKRFRPLLTYLMSDFFEIPLSSTGLFARAIEMTHSATLAHDDVIDLADDRRGQKTLNAETSNKKAILSGDYLLAQTMLELSETGDIRFVQELSLVLQSLVDGEWLQMENHFHQKVSQEQIEEVAQKKTASALTWCCLAPAIQAGASEEILELIKSFGKQLGIAFQEIDDVIDFHEDLNKNTLQDLRNGVFNSVSYTLVKNNPDLREKMIQVQGLLQNHEKITFPWKQDELQKALDEVRLRAKTRLDRCRPYLQEILNIQGRQHNPKAVESLQTLEQLLDFLAHRKF